MTSVKSMLTVEERDAIGARPRHMAALRILTWFHSIGKIGGTMDACGEALGLPNQSVTPRGNELVRVGCLAATGERRLTRNNRTAAVYVFHDASDLVARLDGKAARGKSSQRAITPTEEKMLAAAKKFVRGRRTATSREQVKKLAMNLVRSLDNLQVSGEDS